MLRPGLKFRTECYGLRFDTYTDQVCAWQDVSVKDVDVFGITFQVEKGCINYGFQAKEERLVARVENKEFTLWTRQSQRVFSRAKIGPGFLFMVCWSELTHLDVIRAKCTCGTQSCTHGGKCSDYCDLVTTLENLKCQST